MVQASISEQCVYGRYMYVVFKMLGNFWLKLHLSETTRLIQLVERQTCSLEAVGSRPNFGN